MDLLQYLFKRTENCDSWLTLYDDWSNIDTSGFVLKNNIDTSGFVLKTKYDRDKSDFKKELVMQAKKNPNISGLVKKNRL